MHSLSISSLYLFFILVTPLIACLLIFISPKNLSRWVSLVSSLFLLIVSCYFFFFESRAFSFFPLVPNGASALATQIQWNSFLFDGLQNLGFEFVFDINRTNQVFIVLTEIATFFVFHGYFFRSEKISKMHNVLYWILNFSLATLFFAQNLLLFYIFWEGALIPILFLMNVKKGPQSMTSLIFFVTMFIGSLCMLAGVLLIYSSVYPLVAGSLNFNFLWNRFSMDALQSQSPLLFGLNLKNSFLLLFGLSCCIKLPLVPLHTWFIRTYDESDTQTTLFLSSIVSKMGLIGYIKLISPFSLLPALRDGLHALCVITILYGGILAFYQTSTKKLLAYASLSHVALIFFGLTLGDSPLSLFRALFLTLSHGLISIGLFYIYGWIENGLKDTPISNIHNLIQTSPRIAFTFFVFVLALMGLPGLSNFVGELLVFSSAVETYPVSTLISMFTILLSAIYGVSCIGKLIFKSQDTKEAGAFMKDFYLKEWIAPLCLLILICILGLHPKVFFLDEPFLPITSSIQTHHLYGHK